MATIGQLYDTLSVFANRGRSAGWDSLDQDSVQAILRDPDGLTKNFIMFMGNGACMILGDLTIIPVPFDVKKFVGENWEVIKEDHDPRNDSLGSVNFSQAEFVTCLNEGETRVPGEVKLTRLKAGNQIRLGASTFLGLWRDWEAKGANSVLESLFRLKGITYMDFSGDVLQNPDRIRYVLYLCRDDVGQWRWHYSWLDHGWLARLVSAVFPQVSA